MKASKYTSESKINSTASKLNPTNNKKFMSKALEKYLDDKIKIDDESLFMDNVEKIQKILNNSNDINNFRLGSIPSTTKCSDRKQQQNLIESFNNQIHQMQISNKNKIKENPSQITITDYDDLRRNLEINNFTNSNSNKTEKNTQKKFNFFDKDIAEISK